VAVADDQRHAERDRDGRRRRHDRHVHAAAEHGGLPGAAREHARQEEQAGEPHGDRGDVEELQPEVHRLLLPVVVLAAYPPDAAAHAGDAAKVGLAVAWLALAAWYALGARGRLGPLRVAAFAGGWATLGVALLSR